MVLHSKELIARMKVKPVKQTPISYGKAYEKRLKYQKSNPFYHIPGTWFIHEQKQLIAELYKSKWSTDRIAIELHCSINTVRKYRNYVDSFNF